MSVGVYVDPNDGFIEVMPLLQLYFRFRSSLLPYLSRKNVLPSHKISHALYASRIRKISYGEASVKLNNCGL